MRLPDPTLSAVQKSRFDSPAAAFARAGQALAGATRPVAICRGRLAPRLLDVSPANWRVRAAMPLTPPR